MTPTPTPTPIPPLVVADVMYYTSQNYLQIVGAVWAILFLFVFASMAGDRVKNQNAFLIIVLVSFPVLLVNAGWWAITVYFGYLLYLLATVFLRLVGGG